MIRSRRIALAAASALALAAVAPAAVAQGRTPVKLSMEWRWQGPQSLFHIAQSKGYFAQEGLDVQVDIGMGSSSAIQRLASGAYDAAVGDITSLIEFLANNPGATRFQAVYMMYDDAPIALWTLRKYDVKSVRDFAGKTLAGAPFEAARKLWPLIAQRSSIGADSVKWAGVDPQLRAQTVINGSAQGMGGFANAWNEFTMRGVAREDVVGFRLTDLGIRIYGNALLVSTRLIESNPKAVQGLVRATNRAFLEMIGDIPAAIAQLKQKEPLTDERLETQNLESMIPFIVTDYTRANGVGQISKLKLEQQVDDVAAAFALKTKPSADLIFNSSFLPPRAERLPRVK
jgi:NitT/TauT family transport system substrate-binding protein